MSLKLTVIIRDESPYIHLGEPVAYRRVTLDLTEEQQAGLRLRHKDEKLSLYFIEEPVRDE